MKIVQTKIVSVQEQPSRASYHCWTQRTQNNVVESVCCKVPFSHQVVIARSVDYGELNLETVANVPRVTYENHIWAHGIYRDP